MSRAGKGPALIWEREGAQTDGCTNTPQTHIQYSFTQSNRSSRHSRALSGHNWERGGRAVWSPRRYHLCCAVGVQGVLSIITLSLTLIWIESCPRRRLDSGWGEEGAGVGNKGTVCIKQHLFQRHCVFIVPLPVIMSEGEEGRKRGSLKSKSPKSTLSLPFMSS